MSTLVGVEAYIFDAYGTLFDLKNPVAARAARVGDKAFQLSELWRQKQLEYSWIRSLMGSHADFWKVTGDALDFTLDNLNINDPALRSELMELYLSLPAFEEVPDVLRTLRSKGLKTGILSNGSPTMLTSVVNHSNIAASLDFILSVEEIGIFKPSHKVYHLAAERLNITPEKVAFFSSNAWDIAGASSFGFQAVWCNRGNAPNERLPGQPIAEITNLKDILDLLEG
jgi:2-haloacid dehalogenase